MTYRLSTIVGQTPWSARDALVPLLPFLLALYTLHAQTPLRDAFAGSFRIGAALNQSEFDEQNPTADAMIKAQFNTISPENVLKWESVHPQPDVYRFEEPDRYVDFGVRNHMFIVGHNLVWHNQVPRWVFQDDKGAPLTRDALLERLRQHIFTVVGRYKGRIGGWDVVNEALNEDGTLRQSQWLKIIGEDYIEKAFEFAHEADPAAELYYNDYSLENEPKLKGAVELIRKLQAHGVPVTAIGLQGHDNLEWPTVAQQDAAILAFSRLGIKVNISELDIDVLPRATRQPTAEASLNVAAQANLNPYVDGLPDDMQQKLAKRYGDLFGVFVKYRGVMGRVTFWGVTDADSWLNNWPVRGRTSYPLLFDRHGHFKPALNAVIRASLYPKAQYDESKVPTYTLPDPLILESGQKATSPSVWTEQRRPELIHLFETYVFGRTMVGRPADTTYKVVFEDRHSDGGKTITKTVKLIFSSKNEKGPFMDLRLILPNTGHKVPVFLLAGGAENQIILDRGYGIVMANVLQIQADNNTPAAYAKSVRGFFAKPGQTEPGPEEWGAIGAWAWALSRAMDYLETDSDVDAHKVSLNGVSRFGKAAMWAGAQDTRFAMTFSGEAGCGGQTIVRREFGETIKSMTDYAPHWFDARFKEYGDKVNELPVDFHELIALYAPRPVYIATAQQDYWGDPYGSFLAAAAAEPVYRLFGETGLGTIQWPPVDTPIGNFVGYHNRTGTHGENSYDWARFLDFADRHLGIHHADEMNQPPHPPHGH